jgi:hypothetical protein
MTKTKKINKIADSYRGRSGDPESFRGGSLFSRLQKNVVALLSGFG